MVDQRLPSAGRTRADSNPTKDEDDDDRGMPLMPDEESWVPACKADDLPDGEVMLLDVTPPIAVYRVDGEFFATDDTCTHEVSSLSDGYVDGGVIECAYHFAKFCIRTGAVLSLPATEPIGTYSVKVVDGSVLIDTSRRSVPAAAPDGRA
jgi:3-phenylpropionate/trans-cinnamate dioxygenase ferredoxin component